VLFCPLDLLILINIDRAIMQGRLTEINSSGESEIRNSRLTRTDHHISNLSTDVSIHKYA